LPTLISAEMRLCRVMQRQHRHTCIAAVALLCLLSTGYSAAVQRDLVYVIDEECDVGTSIGHLAPDAGLNDQYPPEVAGSLRFRFLSPAPDYIGLDESTGWLFVSGRVDRDVICRPDEEICRVQQDVAVQPVQYFSILKVSKELLLLLHTCVPMRPLIFRDIRLYINAFWLIDCLPGHTSAEEDTRLTNYIVIALGRQKS